MKGPTDNWEMIPRYRDIRYTHLLVIDGLLHVPKKKKVSLQGRKSVWGLIRNALPDVLDLFLERYCPVPYECCQRHACGYFAVGQATGDQQRKTYRTNNFAGELRLSRSAVHRLGKGCPWATKTATQLPLDRGSSVLARLSDSVKGGSPRPMFCSSKKMHRNDGQ